MLGALLTAVLAIGGAELTTVAQTPHFEVRATAAARGSAVLLTEELEATRGQIVTALGHDWPGVTEVRVGVGRAEYEAIALPGGTPPPWAIALAYPDVNVVLVEALSLNRPEGAQTVRHELVHVALGQLGRGWPHWFQEGLAQAITGERRFRWSQFATLAQAVAFGRIFHFDDLTERFPDRPEDVEYAYAQSVAFVDFLRERHGAAGMSRLLDFVGQGDHFELAFAKAFGLSLGMEEKRFRETLPGLYPWWVVLTSESSAWALGGALLVVAFVVRRREVRRRRAAQAARERIEDAAVSLVMEPVPAANDEGALDTLPLAWPPIGPPWRVSVVDTAPDEVLTARRSGP